MSAPKGKYYDYRILEEIGRTNHSVVSKVEKNGFICTLKMATSHEHGGTMIEDSPTIAEFEKEAEILHTLAEKKVPGVVEFYEWGPKPVPWIAMEFMDGGNLRDRMIRKMSLDDAIKVTSSILDTLYHASRYDIIHRDIKPENILINSKGEVKLTDWGIAKLLSSQDKSTTSFKGTFLYSAPEQFNDEKFGQVDCRTDVYQAGAVLYEMVTGRCPFEASSEEKLLYLILNEKPERPSKINSNIPQELDEIILRALNRKKENRFRDASEFMSALEKLNPITQKRIKYSAHDSKMMPSGGEQLNDLMKKAKDFIEMEMFDEALDCLDKMLATDPNDKEALQSKIDLLVDMENYDDALSIVEQIISGNPNEPVNWIAKAQILLKKDNCEDAIVNLNKALQLDPKNKDAWYLKGQALFDNDVDEAIRCFEKAIKIEPGFAYAWLWKGYSLTSSEYGDAAEAVKSFQKAIKNLPNDQDLSESIIFDDDGLLTALDRVIEDCSIKKEIIVCIDNAINMFPLMTLDSNQNNLFLYGLAGAVVKSINKDVESHDFNHLEELFELLRKILDIDKDSGEQRPCVRLGIQSGLGDAMSSIIASEGYYTEALKLMEDSSQIDSSDDMMRMISDKFDTFLDSLIEKEQGVDIDEELNKALQLIAKLLETAPNKFESYLSVWFRKIINRYIENYEYDEAMNTMETILKIDSSKDTKDTVRRALVSWLQKINPDTCEEPCYDRDTVLEYFNMARRILPNDREIKEMELEFQQRGNDE